VQFFTSRRDQVMALVARYAIPAICPFRKLVTIGGQMKCGPSLADAFCQTGDYVGQVLKAPSRLTCRSRCR
jgi:putative ABC transport system substrate-binding protein